MYTFFAKHKKMDTFFDENPENFRKIWNSNFSKEILTEQTPTLTNNCSESLHSALIYFMHRGHLTKVNFLNFLKNFLYKN